MPVKILDCTIRDGGHLNEWRFEPEVVRAAYFAAQRAGVDYFEVGYRYPRTERNLGEFAHCTDAWLKEVLPPGQGSPAVTVMLDAGRCHTGDFLPCGHPESRVQAVRVAAYPYELERAFGLLQSLLDLGYEVFLNLMASSELGETELIQLRDFGMKTRVSALCFADSFGSFRPEHVREQVERLNPLGYPRLGFHPHNNLQLAFANSLTAVECGVEVIDASILGMGRGAGNLPVELWVGHLEWSGERQLNAAPYLNVIDRHFNRLREEVAWGYSLAGLMSGLSNLHPYYVNGMVEEGLYTTDEMWNALSVIKAECPISYSAERLKQVMDKRGYVPLTKERAKAVSQALVHQIHTSADKDAVQENGFALEQIHSDRHFLVIATGPSVLREREAIKSFSAAYNCVTIGVNHLAGLYEPDYHVFVSRKRFERYAPSLSARSQLLLPAFFGRDYVQSIVDRPVKYFNCEAPSSGTIPPWENGKQNCLALNVSTSAILLAFAMGASTISVVGMDGYMAENDKHLPYFYDEESQIEDAERASARYDLLAAELDRLEVFLAGHSVAMQILTPTSHRRFYRPLEALLKSQNEGAVT